MSTLLRETQPANNRIAGYLPQHADANGTYVATGEENPMPVQVNFVKGMVPVQFQETLKTQSSIPTHTGVTVPSNTYMYGQWIPTNGYDKFGVNITMLNGTGMTVKIELSLDGSAYLSEKVLYDGSSVTVVEEYPITAPYFRLLVRNKDAAVKTVNASVLLKS
jgi:hypothetical protein